MKSMKYFNSSMRSLAEVGYRGVNRGEASLFFPSVAANEFDKLAGAEILGANSFWSARDSGQSLVGFGSEGNHQMAADGQLIDQGLRRFGRGGGDQDPAVGREFIPAVCAVEAFDGGVINAKTPQTALSFARKFRDAFEGEDLAGDGREHGGLITRPGAGFDRAVVVVHPQQFGLPRDDVGLRDRLVEFDGQRMIAVGMRPQRFGHEEVARDSPHRGQDAFVVNVIMIAQPLDHYRPGAGVMRAVLSVVMI